MGEYISPRKWERGEKELCGEERSARFRVESERRGDGKENEITAREKLSGNSRHRKLESN